MALLWIEGFEGFDNGVGSAPVGVEHRYTDLNRMGLVDIDNGRVSGRSMKMNTTSAPRFRTTVLGSLITTMIVGFAFRGDTWRSNKFIEFTEDDASVGLNLRMTAGGDIEIRRNNTLLETATAGLTTGDWYYIEFKYTIDGSSGSYELRVNESTIASDSGIDTLEGATAGIRQVGYFGSTVSADAWTFDDMYIVDTTGSTNNDFVGNTRVVTLFPESAGDDTQWTPDAGNNFERVDEAAPDDDSSYVESSTTGQRDLYNYPALPTDTDTIQGVQVATIGRETDVTDFTLITPVKSGGTLYKDAAQAVGGTSYEDLRRVLEVDPDTSVAWTKSGVDSAQFGIEVG